MVAHHGREDRRATTRDIAIMTADCTLVDQLKPGAEAQAHALCVCSSQGQLFSRLRRSLVAGVILDCRQLVPHASIAVIRLVRQLSPGAVTVALIPDTYSNGPARILDAGADDCLISPFREDELFARVRARLRRGSGTGANLPGKGNLDLNWSDFSVAVRGRVLALRRAEFNVLAYLVSNAGRTVSAREILTVVLGTSGDGGSVRNHIMALRRAFAEARVPDVIVTRRGCGYRFDNDACHGGAASMALDRQSEE